MKVWHNSHKPRWNTELRVKLIELYFAGHTIRDIASMLGDGLTDKAVDSERARLGLFRGHIKRKRPRQSKKPAPAIKHESFELAEGHFAVDRRSYELIKANMKKTAPKQAPLSVEVDQ